jgi:hypothetical protein
MLQLTSAPKTIGRPVHRIAEPRIRPHVAQLTWWLDEAFRIPGTSMRVGLDAIIGLIPGLGDLLTVAAGILMLREAQRLGLPRHQQARMIWNYAVDVLIGIVPILGDIFDATFKAHKKNLSILQKHIAGTKIR